MMKKAQMSNNSFLKHSKMKTPNLPKNSLNKLDKKLMEPKNQNSQKPL